MVPEPLFHPAQGSAQGNIPTKKKTEHRTDPESITIVKDDQSGDSADNGAHGTKNS
jgi:hypothetical protein